MCSGVLFVIESQDCCEKTCAVRSLKNLNCHGARLSFVLLLVRQKKIGHIHVPFRSVCLIVFFRWQYSVLDRSPSARTPPCAFAKGCREEGSLMC
jgi:hypothetical protein